MKTTALILASFLLVNVTAEARSLAPSRDTGFKTAELSTSHRFDPLSLKGKNQKPFGLGVQVEDDKWLEDLLGARSHFNDRIRRDQERQ